MFYQIHFIDNNYRGSVNKTEQWKNLSLTMLLANRVTTMLYNISMPKMTLQ